jgi:hypothetical protein
MDTSLRTPNLSLETKHNKIHVETQKGTVSLIDCLQCNSADWMAEREIDILYEVRRNYV